MVSFTVATPSPSVLNEPAHRAVSAKLVRMLAGPALLRRQGRYGHVRGRTLAFGQSVAGFHRSHWRSGKRACR